MLQYAPESQDGVHNDATPIGVRGITVMFGEFRALHGVSFEVAPRERLAVIGPNGAGKSTLFNVLTGEIEPTEGRVSMFGHDVTDWRTEAIIGLGVGRSFQQASVFPEFTVLENLQFALLAAGRLTNNPLRRAWRARAEEAEALAEVVGLAPLAHQPAGELSHGDERALELGLSLAQDPRALLLDEPTAGMAPEETRFAMDLIRRLADERGLTLVFTEHDMDVVFNVASRVIVLAEGRVVVDGPPDEVRGSELVRQVYLGDD